MTIFNIFLKEVKTGFKSIVFIMLILVVIPLVMSFVYGMGYEKIINPDRSISNIKTAYVDMDKGEFSKSLKEIFYSDKVKGIVNLKEENELSKVNDELVGGDIDAAIIIPKNFSNNIKNNMPSEIKIIKSSSSSVKSQIVYQIVKSYSQTFNNISAIYTALQENGENIRDNKMLGGEIAAWGIGVSTTNYTNIVEVSREKTLSSKQIFATSMFSLMSLFVCITGTLGMIKERDSKTLDRLKSTSVSYEKLFYGKLLFIFTTSFLSGLLYILINSIIGIGWGDNPLRLIMMVILHSFALTGITAVFMNIFKKQQTATGVLASGLGIMGSLGGTFFPVEYSSAVMKKIANGTINYWIQNSYGKIITGRSFNELAVNIIVLLSIGILGMLIGTAAARKSSRL